MPEPPCFEGVHWRVLKEPIKVSNKQLQAIHRLLKERIDPVTCKKETAAEPRGRSGEKVGVNRPIQTTTAKHKAVYCECLDWDPNGEADQAHCALTLEDRGAFIFTGESNYDDDA